MSSGPKMVDPAPRRAGTDWQGLPVRASALGSELSPPFLVPMTCVARLSILNCLKQSTRWRFENSLGFLFGHRFQSRNQRRLDTSGKFSDRGCLKDTSQAQFDPEDIPEPNNHLRSQK